VVKRLFWLTLGFGLGVGITVRARHTVRRTLERHVPPATRERLRAMNAAIDDRAASIRARKPRRGS
jgi:hypothetical protein